MRDCVKLASKVCDLLAELREKCVNHLRKAIDVMHTAKEALQPHR